MGQSKFDVVVFIEEEGNFVPRGHLTISGDILVIILEDATGI